MVWLKTTVEKGIKFSCLFFSENIYDYKIWEE